MFRQLSASVLDSMRAGASVRDAAQHVGCSPRTVERWLSRGREDEPGYIEFARAVDGMREARAIEPNGQPLSERELRIKVWEAVRAGSVPAMRLYWEILRADDADDEQEPDGLAELDELAARRRRAASGGAG